MATLGNKDQIDILLNVDGKNSKETLTEINKLVKDMAKNAKEAGDKISEAGKQMNKMFATTKAQYSQILKQRGMGSLQQLGVIQDIRRSEKELASRVYASPFRTTAQAFTTNEKILNDAGKSMANGFAQNLKSYLAGNKGAYSFDTASYMRSAEYRKKVNRGFSQVEKELSTGLAGGKDVKAQMTALLDLKEKDVVTTDKQIAAQEKLKTVSGGALAFIQARLMANYMVLNSVTNAFSYLTRYVVEFDQELRNLQAIVDISDTSLKALRDDIIDIANTTKFTSLELTKAAVVLGQAGLSVEQIKDTLGPIAHLATATGTDLATSTQTITSALNIYNLQADEAAYVTNALTTAMNESKAEIKGFQYTLQYAGNTAANLGMSLEETAAATAALAQSGIKSVSTQGTGLRAVLTELIKPSQKFQAQLAKVGLSIADVDVRTKGFIPVLKTLKEAGFGVTEAYRGMERRGAAAMVAILNQTDFMDTLTEKMTLSQAGIEGNNTQMKGLENTFKRTKSIVGSLVSTAFDPLVKVLQSTLEGFNKLTNSVGGNIVAFTTYLGLASGVVAVLIKATAAVGALAAKFGSFAGVAKVLGGVAALGAGKITIIVASLAAVAAGIGYAVEKLGLFSDSYDEALGNLEAEQGKLNKAKEGYNAFANVISKAYIQREKFIGPNGQKELEKYVNMIRTRFPQIADILKEPINSFEDLAKALEKANIELAKFNATAEVGLPKAAEKVTEGAAKEFLDVSNLVWNKEEDIDRVLNDLNFLRNKGIITNESSNKLLSESTGIFRRFKRGEDNLGLELRDNAPKQLSAALRQSYNEDPKEAAIAIRAALSDGSIQLSEGLRKVLESFLKEIEVKEKQFNERINLQLEKDLSGVANNALDVYTWDLNRTKEYYRNILSNPNISSADFRREFEGVRSKAESGYKALTGDAELRKLVTDTIPFEQLIDYSNKYTQGNQNEFINLAVNKLKELFASTSSEYLNFLDELEGVSEKVSQTAENDVKEAKGRKFKDTLKSLKTLPIDELDNQVEKSKRELEVHYKTLIEQEKKKSAGDAVMLAARDLHIRELEAQWKQQEQQLDEEAKSVKASISSYADTEKKFFESIQTNLNNIESQYKQRISYLENKYVGAEGRAEVYGELGAGVAQEAENYRISQEMRADNVTKLSIMQQALQRYNAEKERIESTAEYRSANNKVIDTKKALEDLEKSGKASAMSIESARKAYDDAVANQKKHTDVVNDLDESILALTGDIDKLKAKIEAEEYMKKSDDPVGAAKLGFTNAIDAYAKNNAYMGEGKGGNFFVSQVVGETFFSTINEAESALATFFDTAISGTKSTGDAFKDMCTSILEAMRQALISEITKQFMAMIFGSSQTKNNSNSSTSLIIQGITSVIGAGFSSADIFGGTGVISESGGVTSSATYTSNGQMIGFIPHAAQGGIVRGGIKNRDSVPTMLMPGEFVLRKSAVDSLGTDFLSRLNSGNANFMDMANQSIQKEGDNSNKKESTLNIWVVSQDQVPPENSENIILTVSKDIRTNGSIKQLIKQVSMGAL